MDLLDIFNSVIKSEVINKENITKAPEVKNIPKIEAKATEAKILQRKSNVVQVSGDIMDIFNNVFKEPTKSKVPTYADILASNLPKPETKLIISNSEPAKSSTNNLLNELQTYSENLKSEKEAIGSWADMSETDEEALI